MVDAVERLKGFVNGKKIILLGATTSARDILETVLPQIGAKAEYVCDFNAEKQGVSFENGYQEVYVRGADALREENPNDIFILITTLFDEDAADYLNKLGITNFMSAREILNETVKVADYWNDRYKKGYDTGVQTTGYLMEKQVEFVNSVITENNIETVFELGCGDGKMIPFLKLKNYVGVDIAPEAIRICNEKFKDDAAKQFYTIAEYAPETVFDLSLSLGNVIPSLPDDAEYVKYMDTLFGASKRFVCVFSSDFDSERFGHIKARNFSRYVEENLKDWRIYGVKETEYKYKDGDPTAAKFYIYKKNGE